MVWVADLLRTDASLKLKWKVEVEVSPKLPVQGELNLNLAP